MGEKGIEPMNPIRTFLGSWHCMVLLALKPLIHWLFGWAVSTAAGNGLWVRAALVFWLTAGTTVVAAFITFVASTRQRGPQPAAYGHIQTLADLVDEWSTRMFWGHKGASRTAAHAGTSSELLPPIDMTMDYASIIRQ